MIYVARCIPLCPYLYRRYYRTCVILSRMSMMLWDYVHIIGLWYPSRIPSLTILYPHCPVISIRAYTGLPRYRTMYVHFPHIRSYRTLYVCVYRIHLGFIGLCACASCEHGVLSDLAKVYRMNIRYYRTRGG